MRRVATLFCVLALSLGALVPLRANSAPPEGKTFTVGLVQMTDVVLYDDTIVALRKELDRIGWGNRKQLKILRRVALGQTKGIWDKLELLSALHGYIDEFIERKVDLIVTVGTPATTWGAERAHAAGIPTMFMAVSMPGVLDFRDEGWLTGSTTFVHPGRILRLISNTIPDVKRVGMILSTDPNARGLHELLAPVAREVGITLMVYEVDKNEDAVAAAQYFLANTPDAFLVIPDTWAGRDDEVNSKTMLAQLFRKTQLPIIAAFPEATNIFPNDVALSVGVSFASTGTAAASLVDQILNGTPPGSIPIAAPTKPEIHVRKAAALRTGFPLTPALLKIADEVVE